MSEFRAKVRMRVDTKRYVEQDNTDFVSFLTNLLADPDLGVIVTNVNQIDLVSMKAYEVSVHVRVIKPPEFEKVEPRDYCRIHMTDEDFGFDVLGVEIENEPN